MNKKMIGQKGEEMAIDYLIKKGYEVLRRNYRSGRNEVDIIARIHEFLVFIEVKYRTTIKYGYPEEMVTGEQEDRIRDAAESFMMEEKWDGAVRYDIIAISPKETHSIFHIHDAF